MNQIKGTVEKVFYHQNDWASFILKTNQGDRIRCAGDVHDFKEGIDVEIEAEANIHPKYGLQYKIVLFKLAAPEGREGIRAFLSSGIVKGIGPKTAEKIVNRFGDRTLQVIRTNPESLLAVPGVNEKKLAALQNAVSDFYIHEELFNLTNGNITMNEVNKIIKCYGKDSADILKYEPYRLWKDIDGFGFLKNDRIALACGHSAMSNDRIMAAIEYTLDQIGSTKGHCYVTIDEMQETSLEVLNRIPEQLRSVRGLERAAYAAYDDWENEEDRLIAKFGLDADQTSALTGWKRNNDRYVELLADAIDEADRKKRIILDGEYVASKRLYYAEKDIAASVRHMLSLEPQCRNRQTIRGFIESYEREIAMYLSDEQKQAVLTGLTNRISIITGGPGRGKTTIIRFLAQYWRERVHPKNKKGDVIILAPTGRAAQRAKESLPDAENIDISTIHKMTGFFGPRTDDGKGIPFFGKPMREANPDTLIICDECSMLDVVLGKELMKFSENSTLVLVGDEGQLPPVGPGNMFRDLIRSGIVPVARLTACYRNSGLIAENAERINRGNPNITAGEGFRIETMEREEMTARIVRDYMTLIRCGVEAKDISVISLQRKRGAVAVNVLNTLIQNAYNPVRDDSQVLGGFRVGDRVMQIRNNYTAEYVLENGKRGSGVYNGDLGTVRYISQDEQRVYVLFDDGKLIEYGRLELDELVIAYAMTVHKVQGSEFPYVLIALSRDQYMILSKEAVYTAITRAKTCVTAYVEKGVLRLALSKEGAGDRNTRLSERLVFG